MEIFKKLALVDVSKQVEKKNGLNYLSWSFAWSFVKNEFPSAKYKVIHFDGKPYLFDENLGYLVATEVEIEGETIAMQLPVMDGANKAQKNKPYTYKIKNGERVVEAATMFDINTAIMRCLVKNLAMFGLGISLYSGEDLPEIKEIKNEEDKTKNFNKKPPINPPKTTPPVEPPKTTVKEAVEALILKLENNEITDFEKSRIWLLENQTKISTELLNKATDLINQKQNKVVNIETNLDEITDDQLANFDPNYVN